MYWKIVGMTCKKYRECRDAYFQAKMQIETYRLNARLAVQTKQLLEEYKKLDSEAKGTIMSILGCLCDFEEYEGLLNEIENCTKWKAVYVEESATKSSMQECVEVLRKLIDEYMPPYNGELSDEDIRTIHELHKSHEINATGLYNKDKSFSDAVDAICEDEEE